MESPFELVNKNLICRESIPLDNQLARLDSLCTELFNPSTSNEKKKQVEHDLSCFPYLHDPWFNVFYYFQRSNNDYTKMYCLSILERKIVRNDDRGLVMDFRIGYRNFKWRYLLQNNSQLSVPIRNKLCKIMVIIAKQDWPARYPDFIENTMQLLVPDQSQNIANSFHTISLGLTLTNLAIEEFYSLSSYSFGSNRRTELTKLFEAHMPLMLHHFTSLLEQIISKHVNFVSATPPPSPSSSPNSESCSSLDKGNFNFYVCL